MEPLLDIREVSKSFGAVPVLDRLTLSVQRGEVFGLLGLNGAGKTTLFKCVLQLLFPTGGEVHYEGRPLDLPTIHAKIGYLPEFYLPPGELTAREYLRLLGWAVASPRPDAVGLLAKTGLDPDKPIADYSRGMIQRLGVAIALLKDPEFLILDEPTLGLDPLVRQRLLDWLRELNGEGKTILLSSHDFTQVEKLCQRIAVLHDRSLRYLGTIEGFRQKHGAASLEDAFLQEIGGSHA